METLYIWTVLCLIPEAFPQMSIDQNRFIGGENIALRKPTRQSSDYSDGNLTYSSSLAVDGNTDADFSHKSCSATCSNRPAWWSVDLEEDRIIKKIVIVNTKGYTGRLRGAQVLGFTNNGTLIEIKSNEDFSQDIITIIPSTDKLVRNVTIILRSNNINTENIINMCEVEIYADLNIARGKPAEQSSTYEGFSAGLAVDGNPSGDFNKDRSCTATRPMLDNPPIPSWSVNLEGEYLISFIKIYNRKNDIEHMYTQRLGNFIIMASSRDNVQFPLYKESTGDPASVIEIPLYRNLSLRVTRITITIPSATSTASAIKRENILTLCEVQVYKAIECQKYHLGNGNVSVTLYGDNQKEFTYGTILRLTCLPGFQFSDNENSTTTTCESNGAWTKRSVCRDIDECTLSEYNACSNHGDCRNTVGSFSCDCSAGYYGVSCENVVRCANPIKELDNAELFYQSGIDGNLSYNATISLRCNVGYNLTGEDKVRCNEYSRWDGTLGNCSVVRCVDPIERNNSVFVYQSGIYGNLTYNATISIRCQEGYSLTGNDLVRCSKLSRWDGNLGTCLVVRCVDTVTERNNGVLLYQSGIDGNLTYNATVSIQCQVGYNLTGKVLVRCNEHSQWDGTLGNCSVIRCPSLPYSSQHGVLHNTHQGTGRLNYSFEARYRLQCDPGYESKTTTDIVCTELGLWNDSIDACQVTQKYTQPESSVAAVAGGVSAASCAIILGVIITFIFYKRKSRGLEHKVDDTTLYEIPTTAKGREQEENDIVETPTYAQPKNKKDLTESPECGEQKHVYMNNNESSGDYHSFKPQKVTDKNSIRVEDLSSFFLRRKIDTRLYEEEYNKLPNGLTKSYDDALLPDNRSKNRYKNIYPYDETRVKLDIWDPSIGNDYINACYIHGFKTVHAYIAAQGPTKGILNDFWRMIWQTKCSKIVMLTNLTEEGKHKCEKYWPDEGSVKYGDIAIRLVQCETFSDFTMRTLEMKKTNGRQGGATTETYQIKQFHFTAWPDRGVPRFASSLVHFRHKVHATKTGRNTECPMVVHCSAGIGRTGTFIALDYLVDQAEEMGYINVVNCVEILRKQRVSLVQTLEQYIFLHEALIEALTCSTNVTSPCEFHKTYRNLLERDNTTGKRKLDDEFEKLPMYVSDPVEDVYENAKVMENRNKNRYSNILPDKNHCPFLNVYVKGRDSYINAVFLPAYMENDIFIITQTPLQNTVVDFWRMVYQFQVSSIVMLNTLSEMKEEERYWTEDEETLEILPFRITLESKFSDDICTNYTMLLTYHDEHRRVRLSRGTYWADGKPVPKSPSAMLKQIHLIQNWQQETGSKPIVVHCMNGAERSGLFCVISALLERIKIEQDVAIEQTIKQMRTRRPQVIPNVDQFKFCYDAVLGYLDEFDTYSNFTGL